MAKDLARCMSDRARRKNLDALYDQRDACTDEQGWAALTRIIVDLEREDYLAKQAKKLKANHRRLYYFLKWVLIGAAVVALLAPRK